MRSYRWTTRTMTAPNSAPTAEAAPSVCEPAAIESRIPKSMPPYMPIIDAGIMVSNMPRSGESTSPTTR
jgi:hypothetical protein